MDTINDDQHSADISTKKKGRAAVPVFSGGLIWTLVLILGAGFLMVSSASLAYADKLYDDTFYFVKRHLIFLLISSSLAASLFPVSTDFWRKHSAKLFAITLLLLVLVFVPGIGRKVNGASRWINLVLLNFQPSELMKLATVLFVSDYVARKSHLLYQVAKTLTPIGSAMLLVSLLLIAEPDLGATVVVMTLTVSILFLGGIPMKVVWSVLAFGITAVVGLVLVSPYRMKRVMGFTDPFSDPYGSGYQLAQSLIAYGRGDWFGLGLGRSIQKMHYLPEAHTDFIMAIITEEFGVVGLFVMLTLFLTLIWQIFDVATVAKKLTFYYQALVAQAIGIWIAIQVFINVSATIGLVPTKGLTLPFVSFGGSAMLVLMAAMAIVFRIDYENRCAMQGGRK
jgi:cell division protein FtsW